MKMNGYESGNRKLIPAVLIYARSEGRVLMLHRNGSAKPGDFHFGKWNGLGGKIEIDESPFEAAKRELKEESGVDFKVEDFKILGVVQFPLFKPIKNEDWLVYVFEVILPQNLFDPSFQCPEGSLHWIDETEVLRLNLWPGDHLFLPAVLARTTFFGTIWYQDGEVEDSLFQFGALSGVAVH